MIGGLTTRQRAIKRAFDLIVASGGLLITWPVIVMAALVSRAETGESGIFRQTRIGRYGEPFEVLKIRTMRSDPAITTTVTVDGDPRITRWGALLRRTKIDELPQLLNVLRGDMSIVGPRPDVPGYYDGLCQSDHEIFSVRPGITGPATVALCDEERILATLDEPDVYSQYVLFPRKVAINRTYVDEQNLWADMRCIITTLRILVDRPSRSRRPPTTARP